MSPDAVDSEQSGKGDDRLFLERNAMILLGRMLLALGALGGVFALVFTFTFCGEAKAQSSVFKARLSVLKNCGVPYNAEDANSEYAPNGQTWQDYIDGCQARHAAKIRANAAKIRTLEEEERARLVKRNKVLEQHQLDIKDCVTAQVGRSQCELAR
jgi:hypothetical protein